MPELSYASKFTVPSPASPNTFWATAWATTLADHDHWVGSIASALTATATYDFLRIHEIQGRPHALFRLKDYNGFTYHGYALGQSEDGRILIEDQKPGEIVPLLSEAIEKAEDMADPQDLIVITGSLFTVGEAMTYFDPETYRSDDLD